jgi:hypothetical protein
MFKILDRGMYVAALITEEMTPISGTRECPSNSLVI